MIIVVKQTAEAEAEALCMALVAKGISCEMHKAGGQTVILPTGKMLPEAEWLLAQPGVAEVCGLPESPHLAGREGHPEDTVVRVGPAVIGGGGLALIAGPCAVEGREQIMSAAKAAAAAGAVMLRGGAFKPRTSPYTFRGLGAEGLRLLKEAGEATGLGVVSEIMAVEQLPLFEEAGIDCLQVGARNMQNFPLLTALGQQKKPVLLKRGLAATYEEWLDAAEYILAEGNPNVILCERGIRTLPGGTRGLLDISAPAVLRGLTHLPVIVDPSHAAGRAEWVTPLAMAAVAAGAAGVMVEIHPEPQNARSDAAQALTPDELITLADRLRKICAVR